jgi:hypothetical protein
VGSLGDLEYGLPPINLLDGVTFPSQGLSPPTVNDLIQAPGALTPDVSLISPDAVFPGQGLISPTMPGIAAMGGGQGATVGVPGGTVGQGGFTPTGAVPVLGDPSSFINDPDVLGQPVIKPESSSISLNDAFRAANLAQSLMAGQPQQQYPNQQLSGTQATGVDLLSLPQFAAGVPNIAGLLNPIPYRGLTFDFYTGLPTSLVG